jgi:hypothetical protein
LSPVFYIVGILSAAVVDVHGHVGVGIALACFVSIAVIWVVPDPRIDRAVRTQGPAE